MTTEVATDDDESPEEEMKQGLLGNVSRFCAKYGLALLEYSHCEKLTKDCTDPRPPVHQTPRQRAYILAISSPRLLLRWGGGTLGYTVSSIYSAPPVFFSF